MSSTKDTMTRIRIDYMANLSLHKIRAQDICYYRRLAVYNFGVHLWEI